MSDKYALLTKMGIKNPQQIVRYSVQTSGNFDILRITYKRESGSLLPGSKKFKFVRTSRTRGEDEGGSKTFKNFTEISPALNDIRSILDEIVKVKKTQKEQIEVIQDEIKILEEDMQAHITYLKSLVENLKS